MFKNIFGIFFHLLRLVGENLALSKIKEILYFLLCNIKFGQISDSMKIPTSGFQWSRNFLTTWGESIGAYWCIILLSKGLIYNSVDNSHLKIYLNSFTLENLKFYFFVPFLWFLLLGDTNKRFKLFLITLITVHTGLSIFIHNHIILPAYYTLEIIFLFWIFYIFFKNKSKFFSKIQILIVLFLINSTFFISYNNIFPNSILIKLDDLSKFKNISYICPNDLKKFTDYEDIVESDLLSGLLNKRYYTNLSYDKNYNFYNYFHLATPLAIPPSIKFNNPCRN